MSADGKMIEANVLSVGEDNLKVRMGDKVFSIPWQKLNPAQEMKLKAEAWLETHYDKFTGSVSIAATAGIKIADEISVTCEALLDPKDEAGDRIKLSFIRDRDDWIWVNDSAVFMLLDDKERRELKGEWKHFPILKYDFEAVSVWFTRAEFEAIAKARSVDFRVGRREFSIPGDTRARFGAMRWRLGNITPTIRTTGTP